MSIQEDAKWPPYRVEDDQLDDTDLAKEQRALVEDPTKAPQAGLYPAEEGGEPEPQQQGDQG